MPLLVADVSRSSTYRKAIGLLFTFFKVNDVSITLKNTHRKINETIRSTVAILNGSRFQRKRIPSDYRVMIETVYWNQVGWCLGFILIALPSISAFFVNLVVEFYQCQLFINDNNVDVTFFFHFGIRKIKDDKWVK